MDDFVYSVYLVSTKKFQTNQVEGITQKCSSDGSTVKLSFTPFKQTCINIMTNMDNKLNIELTTNEKNRYLNIYINGKKYISNRIVVLLNPELIDKKWFVKMLQNECDIQLLLEVLKYERQKILFRMFKSLTDQKDSNDYLVFRVLSSLAVSYKNPIDHNMFLLFNDLTLMAFLKNTSTVKAAEHLLHFALDMLFSYQYFALYASLICLFKKTEDFKVPMLKTYYNCSNNELDIFTQVFPITGILPLFICYNKYAHTKFVNILATWGALRPADNNTRDKITDIVHRRIKSMGHYTLEAVTPYIIFSRDYLNQSKFNEFKLSHQLIGYITKITNREVPTIYHYYENVDANTKYLERRFELLEKYIKDEEEELNEDFTINRTSFGVEELDASNSYEYNSYEYSSDE